MITLAIDTSTVCGAVALLRDDKPLVEETFKRGNLFVALDRLKPDNPDLIVVGVGPGSFMGIRVGIAAAKGLALPRGLPISAVSSFDALALTAAPKAPPDCVQMCVFCDARRDELYTAFYDPQGQPTRECRIETFEEIAHAMHNPIWFVSPEIDRYRAPLGHQFGGFATPCAAPIYPSAAALGWLGVRRYIASGKRGDLSLEPIYLREAEYKKL
ncbi:MAG TPA: tRNA (adenosine(37)-N6)-threonylcarbamoyltransferase complex dimerization subunit type 1 TsaB [Verrucomicrobiae bacterium]|nr:tRNA (adenosine(37)-N6)-threonylcarbamoyltransferase complex dimerization subunit type 1 TsaB [Verrucomicrobiae bacterium]